MLLTQTQQKFLFLLSIIVLYIVLVPSVGFLRVPCCTLDEGYFWPTSLFFSEKPIPSIDDLRSYNELNTPLAFIIYGQLEYWFDQGIVAGRLLNLVLSITMVLIIGWPTKEKGGRDLFCILGLFLCPYYLWLSGWLYTEMIACFWVLMGLVGYIRKRYLWSSVAFVLAIATRQYMLAFPAAIATFEFISLVTETRQSSRINWQAQWRWVLPFIAACSILGWFYLFQGLAPANAYIERQPPDVQKTAWGMDLGGAIHYLSFIGTYIVIPEFLLFTPGAKLRALREQWGQQKYRVGFIALGLLLFMLIFPPQEMAGGIIIKAVRLLPHDALRFGFYYVLSLLTCLRFSRLNLVTFLVFFNAAIMIKAYPWDRYVMPMVVAFWYLKSVGVADQLPLSLQVPNLKRIFS
jgi:hypothetical protein